MANGLKTTSLSEAVYEALRESIVTIEYPPGSLLTESGIATRYGVARPTAKAALERLVSEGLLRRRAHRAATVPVLSKGDVEDLYGTRLLIEEAALRDLGGQSMLPPAALAAHRELQEFAENDELTPFARLDVTFHRELVVGHGSPRLSRMHEVIMGEIQLCMGQLEFHKLLGARSVVSQHQGIIEAVLAGDGDLAGELTKRHILSARDRLIWRLDMMGPADERQQDRQQDRKS